MNSKIRIDAYYFIILRVETLVTSIQNYGDYNNAYYGFINQAWSGRDVIERVITGSSNIRYEVSQSPLLREVLGDVISNFKLALGDDDEI